MTVYHGRLDGWTDGQVDDWGKTGFSLSQRSQSSRRKKYSIYSLCALRARPCAIAA